MGLPGFGWIFWEMAKAQAELTVGQSQSQVLQSFDPQGTSHLKQLFAQACCEVISGQDPTFAECSHPHKPCNGQQDQDWPEQTRSFSRKMSPAALSLSWPDQWASEGSRCCGLPDTPLLH